MIRRPISTLRPKHGLVLVYEADMPQLAAYVDGEWWRTGILTEDQSVGGDSAGEWWFRAKGLGAAKEWVPA